MKDPLISSDGMPRNLPIVDASGNSILTVILFADMRSRRIYELRTIKTKRPTTARYRPRKAIPRNIGSSEYICTSLGWTRYQKPSIASPRKTTPRNDRDMKRFLPLRMLIRLIGKQVTGLDPVSTREVSTGNRFPALSLEYFEPYGSAAT